MKTSIDCSRYVMQCICHIPPIFTCHIVVLRPEDGPFCVFFSDTCAALCASFYRRPCNSWAPHSPVCYNAVLHTFVSTPNDQFLTLIPAIFLLNFLLSNLKSLKLSISQPLNSQPLNSQLSTYLLNFLCRTQTCCMHPRPTTTPAPRQVPFFAHFAPTGAP